MPIYLVERHFAEQMRLDDLGVRAMRAQDRDDGPRWLYSFLSADRRRSYCLYEAPSPETILAAARQAGLPDDVVVEVDRVDPATLGTEPSR